MLSLTEEARGSSGWERERDGTSDREELAGELFRGLVEAPGEMHACAHSATRRLHSRPTRSSLSLPTLHGSKASSDRLSRNCVCPVLGNFARRVGLPEACAASKKER